MGASRTVTLLDWAASRNATVLGPALDARLLAAAQAVEHYEISRYGMLKTLAQQLGLTEAVTLLDKTFNGEKETDAALTKLAEGAVSVAAEAA